jgi:hypothetical protein
MFLVQVYAGKDNQTDLRAREAARVGIARWIKKWVPDTEDINMRAWKESPIHRYLLKLRVDPRCWKLNSEGRKQTKWQALWEQKGIQDPDGKFRDIETLTQLQNIAFRKIAQEGTIPSNISNHVFDRALE